MSKAQEYFSLCLGKNKAAFFNILEPVDYEAVLFFGIGQEIWWFLSGAISLALTMS
jgi:hypothetical protein